MSWGALGMLRQLYVITPTWTPLKFESGLRDLLEHPAKTVDKTMAASNRNANLDKLFCIICKEFWVCIEIDW